MSQQRAGGGGAAPPLAWPPPSPGKVSRPSLAWLLLLGQCLGTGGPRTHSWNRPAQTARGLSLLLLLLPPVPPYTRPFIFPSRCRTKTPCSRALEWEPNGRHRAIGHRSCQAQAGQGMRPPPASSPGPSEGGGSCSASIHQGKGSLLRVTGYRNSR